MDRRGAGRAFPPFLFLLVFFAFTNPLFSQAPILNSYQQNFIRANLSMKANILRDAATDEEAKEFIGPLYEFALTFALGNAEILRDDPEMIALIGVAARGAGDSGYKASADTLWQIFQAYPDSLTRVSVLKALAVLGKRNIRIIGNLNQYLAGQNRLFRDGANPDYPSVSACVSALGQLGDTSSFSALFSAFTASYPNNISRLALESLNLLPDDYKYFLVDLIRGNPAADKLAALKIGVTNNRFSPAEQGQLAEAALEQGLNLSPASPGEDRDLAELRYIAADAFTRLRWTQGSALAVRHFYRVQTDFQNGKVPRERFIEAIDCLSVMESAEAAQALVLQLGFTNARTEKGGIYDEALVLAVIKAVGIIGDKSAFDQLLYISYLPYPDHIQAAAKEALTHLKW
ncbi:MAG: hypothetical protein LBJ90_00235 [Treponema sp.]|jgi:hypothetical protein|nr:hypothetical protein [Treponema sp.]